MRCEGTMKSYAKTSRFVRPKQSLTTVDRAIAEDAPLPQSDVDKGAVDVDPLVSSPLGKIEDVLSNLEQVYDSSTAKWDALRRLEDREHAIMQGLMNPSPSPVKSRPSHSLETNATSALVNTPELAIAASPSSSNAHDEIQQKLAFSTDNSSDDDDEGYHQFDSNELNASGTYVKLSPLRLGSSPYKPGFYTDVNRSRRESLMFILWMWLLISGLWISSTLRKSN